MQVQPLVPEVSTVKQYFRLDQKALYKVLVKLFLFKLNYYSQIVV